MSQINAVLSNTQKATKGLSAAQVALEKLIGTFAQNVVENETVLESVAIAQSKLDDLKEQTDIEVRKATIDFDLRLQEHKNKVITEVLQSNDEVAVDVSYLSTLRDEGANTGYYNKVAINRAVQAAVATVKAESTTALATANSEHAVETAELKADKASLESQVKWLTDSVTKLEESITAERAARVQMAEAASKAAAVTVNTTK